MESVRYYDILVIRLRLPSRYFERVKIEVDSMLQTKTHVVTAVHSEDKSLKNKPTDFYTRGKHTTIALVLTPQTDIDQSSIIVNKLSRGLHKYMKNMNISTHYIKVYEDISLIYVIEEANHNYNTTMNNIISSVSNDDL